MSVLAARRGAVAAVRRHSLVAPTRVLFTQPAEGFGTSSATKTTPTFDVQSGDLITVIGYTPNIGVTLSTPTFTGTGTAALAQSVVGIAQYGNIYVWTVPVSATATGRTISVARAAGSTQFGFHATVWRNHGGLGASAKTNAIGAPSLALTAGFNSAVEVGVDDWNALTGARTWRTVNGAAISESLYANASGVYTCYGGYIAANSVAGSLTLGLTAPTGQNYSTVAVEVLPVGGTAPLNILGVAYWRGLWDGNSTFYANYFTPLSQTGDSSDYYDCSYGIDAYVSLFEATGATAYLTSAIGLVNNMIGDAAISSSLGANAFGDSFLGWRTERIEVPGEEVPLYESYTWRYVCRLLTALKNNPATYADSTFKANYDSILAFTETNIFDKWYTRGLNSYIYRENTNMSSHWAYIALHLRLHTLNATRQTRCDSIRANIDSVGVPPFSNDNLRSKMTASLNRALTGAYSWAETWTDTARPGQDIAHACGEITYICESKDYATGVWTQTDITRFVKTMTDLIMPTQAQYVDGTGAGNGWLADGWPKLGRFSIPAQQALEAYDAVGGGQGQYYASMCANAARWGVA